MITQTWEEYLHLFDQIISGDFTNEIYDKPAYQEYVRMNHSRVHRWLKNGELNADLVSKIQQIKTKQTWILITEPWCGDAAHSTPFIAKLAEINEIIDLKIVLRDENTEVIDQYLTNGGRSIPKLVVRDENNNDIFVWGPRPTELKNIFTDLKKNEAEMDEIHKVLQNWYNRNKGIDIQSELLELFEGH